MIVTYATGDGIKDVASQQAHHVKMNPSTPIRTRMRSYSAKTITKCGACESHATYLCRFEQVNKDTLCYLCSHHKEYYERVQSEILTSDVIIRRLKMIGPLHGDYVWGENECIHCNQSFQHCYARYPLFSYLCWPCKQQSHQLYIDTLMVLRSLFIEDVGVYIVKLMYLSTSRQ